MTDRFMKLDWENQLQPTSVVRSRHIKSDKTAQNVKVLEARRKFFDLERMIHSGRTK